MHACFSWTVYRSQTLDTSLSTPVIEAEKMFENDDWGVDADDWGGVGDLVTMTTSNDTKLMSIATTQWFEGDDDNEEVTIVTKENKQDDMQVGGAPSYASVVSKSGQYISKSKDSKEVENTEAAMVKDTNATMVTETDAAAERLQEMLIDDEDSDSSNSDNVMVKHCVGENVTLKPQSDMQSILQTNSNPDSILQAGDQLDNNIVTLTARFESFYVSVIEAPSNGGEKLKHEHLLLQEYSRREGINMTDFVDSMDR